MKRGWYVVNKFNNTKFYLYRVNLTSLGGLDPEFVQADNETSPPFAFESEKAANNIREFLGADGVVYVTD